MEPWDAENSMALAKCKYEPPDWVMDMKEAHDRRVRRTSKRRSMTSGQIRRAFRKKGW